MPPAVLRGVPSQPLQGRGPAELDYDSSHDQRIPRDSRAQPRSFNRYSPAVDGECRVSLPIHFWRWTAKRAKTKDVLGYLWEFCDREQSDCFVWHTDDQVIEGCGLRDIRHLRQCLEELREAGLVVRECATDGRSGFRVYSRKPYASPMPGLKQGRPKKKGPRRPVSGDRSQETFEKVPGVSRKGPVGPLHLIREQKSIGAEVQTPQEGSSGADAVEPQVHLPGVEVPTPPKPKPTPKPRRSSSKAKPTIDDESAAILLEAQNKARREVASRLPNRRPRPVPLTPGIRQAMADRLAEGYTVEQLCELLERRGRTDGAKGYPYLGKVSCWSANSLEFAVGIEDDEIAVPEGPVRREDGSYEVD